MPVPITDLPNEISVEAAVEAACASDITFIEERLRRGTSVLVDCDKELSLFLYLAIRGRMKRDKSAPRLVVVDGRPSPDPNVPYRGNLPRMMEQITETVRGSVDRTVLVLLHLDVLTTTNTGLTVEAREAIPLLYENPEITVLGFRDPSFEVPKVIRGVFSAKREITGTPRDALPKVITQREAKTMHATDFDAFRLYKYVSGLNPVALRRMFSDLSQRRESPVGRPLAENIYREIRSQTAAEGSVELPNVSLERDIAGYVSTKERLKEDWIDPVRRKEALTDPDAIVALENLLPRGVIFHGPPGTGKCVAAGTLLVDAATGIPRKVEDIVRDESPVYTFSLETGKVVPVSPAAWLCTGEKDCIRVRTRVGHEIEVTPEHPLLTASGWKRAGDLVPGDHIAGASQFPFPENTVDVPDEHLVLLGSLIADGCYTQKFVLYTKLDPGTVEGVRTALRSLDGELRQYEGTNPGNYRVITPRENGKSRIRNLLDHYGLEPARAPFKHLPEIAFRLSPEKLGVFLGALWTGDGEVDPSRGYLTYGSASETLIRQLQHLLLRLGITSNVRESVARCNGKSFEFWDLTVCGTSRRTFAATIRLFGKKKVALSSFQFHENPNDDLIPLTPELRAGLSKAYDRYLAEGKSPAAIGHLLGRRGFDRDQLLRREAISKRVFGAFLEASGAEELRWYGGVRWERVTEIVEIGSRKVYDLSIPETHNFFANDLVAHNTFFAKAVATALNASVIVVSGPEMKSKWVGESEENLRRVFRQARASAPAVIIFDEIDAFASQRGTYSGGSGVEHSMVNQLLTEMDGFRKNEMVFVVATTNFLESIDGALMRPGRFEFLIEIPAPNAEDRAEILRLYDRKMGLGLTPEHIAHLVRRTEGLADTAKGIPYSGDHLNGLCRALKRTSLREGFAGFSLDDLDRALQRKTGRKIILSSEEEKTIAIHEAGHALVAMMLPDATAPERICIAQDIEGALGYVQRAARTRPYTVTGAELRADIAVAFGGSEAERLVSPSGDISVGASGDLQTAATVARMIVERFGMSDDLGPNVSIDGDKNPGEDYRRRVSAEVEKILRAERARAATILRENASLHEALWKLLLEKKVIEGGMLASFVASTKTR